MIKRVHVKVAEDILDWVRIHVAKERGKGNKQMTMASEIEKAILRYYGTRIKVRVIKDN